MSSGAAPMIVRTMSANTPSSDLSANYDYCMVFKLQQDSNKQHTIVPDCAKAVVTLLKERQFDVFSFLSNQKDELLVLIRAEFDKMRKFADDIDFKMELNPEKIKSALAEGKVEGDQYVIAPAKINDDIKYSPYNPYNFVFGKYESDLDNQFYLDIEEDPRTGDKRFTKMVRLKLLYYMLKAPARLGGCELEISSLLFTKQLEAFYPLHDPQTTNSIATRNGSWTLMPWNFPFNDFRSYFGEKIGLYMVFLGHYSKWLVVPAVVGFIFQMVVWGTGNYSSPVLPFFAVLITVWSIMMLEYWKREEKVTAMTWGMIGFEQDEPDRPEFHGDLIKSYINGGEMLYFSKQELAERISGSMTVIGGFIFLLIGVVASIYILRFALEPSIGSNASTVASIANTIQITVFNMVYQKAVVYLTDVENHRTDTEYEDSMIIKLFAFQFVNSYASFFFLAFIAQNLDSPSGSPSDYTGQCGAPTCMAPLAVNLAILFCTRIATGFATNVVAPYVQTTLKKRSEGGTFNMTPPELDYSLLNYNTLIEGINNYADSALQFGFSVLFVTALPLAPLLSLVSNAARIKGMAWKLCRLYQRPIPLGAEDIGTWLPIFQFVSVAAVVTNAGLVCFTMNGLSDYSDWGRVWIFIGFQWTLIGIQFLIQAAIPDEPEEIQIQEQRGKFIVSKIIDGTPDEDPISIEDYELAHRQSLAKVATESVDVGCLKALLGGGPQKSGAAKQFKYSNAKDIVISQYPAGGNGITSNPLSKV